MYPALRYPEPKRRSRFEPYFRHLFAAVYAIVRVSLMLMFIAPAVVAYLAGVFLLNDGQYYSILIGLAVLVGLFAAAVLVSEVFPWHIGKTFPGPPLFDDRRDR